MSKALAQIQASGTETRAQRTVEVCLAQGVVKDVERLAAERDDLDIQIARLASKGDGDAPAKMGSGGDLVARRDEVIRELADKYDVMRENTGRLTVAATITHGEWRRWAEANPARRDGQDENGWPMISAFDATVTRGHCNATALMERAGDFVTEWDGEPLEAGQWEWLEANIAPGDLKLIARAVIENYEDEGAKALPKSLTESPVKETSETS